MKKNYTVVICAHNEEKYIKNAILSCLRQTYPPKEIIVINDRSIDKTFEIASKFSVKIINKIEQRWFFSYTENLEIARKIIKTRYMAIVDADTILEKNYFEELLKNLTEDTGCLGGELITICHSFLCKFIYAWEKTYKYSLDRRPRGCCLLVNKEALDKVGGFRDVPAPDTYIQDKLREKGYKFKIVNTTRAYHVREINLTKIIRGQFYSGIVRYIQKKTLVKTLAHAIFRLRPLVIAGFLYASITFKDIPIHE